MLSSIVLQLRGKSTLPLLNDVNLTVNDISMPIRSYKLLHQNSESDSGHKINVVGKPIFFFANHLSDDNG